MFGWILGLRGSKPKLRDESVSLDPMINHTWIERKLSELFAPESVAAIKRIPLPLSPKKDSLMWIKDPKGCFSVKSAYRSIQEIPTSDARVVNWQKVWKLRIHERLKMMLWRVSSNLLPTMDNLEQRMGIADTVCVCCNGKEESVVHLFFQCTMVRAIWLGLKYYYRSELLRGCLVFKKPSLINSCEDFVKVVTGDLDFPEHAPLRIAITLEAMWNLRNQILHNKELKVNLVSVIGNMELMILEHIRSTKGDGKNHLQVQLKSTLMWQ